MKHITIDLADILETKLQFGVSIPVSIDVDQLLEYGDDDWSHDLDIGDILSRQRITAVLISAEEVQRQYPHLSDEQAWETAERLRDDFEAFLEDAIADAVHINYPTARMQLHSRLLNLRYGLRGRDDEPAKRLLNEVDGLLRVFHHVPESDADPALHGALAAALDDIEDATKTQGVIA